MKKKWDSKLHHKFLVEHIKLSYHNIRKIKIVSLRMEETSIMLISFAVGGEVIHIIISLTAFTIICLVTYFCFRYSEEIVKFFWQNGLNVITRLMGLLIATIGTGMFITGIGSVIKKFVETHA